MSATPAAAITAGLVAVAVAAPAEADPAPVDHLTPDAITVQDYVLEHYPQIRDIGGWRAGDPYPDHPSGRALDVMIPGWDTADGRALGDRLADDLLAHADQLGVESLIWRQEWRTPSGTRQWMAGRGSPNANHFNHVHVLTRGDTAAGW